MVNEFETETNVWETGFEDEEQNLFGQDYFQEDEVEEDNEEGEDQTPGGEGEAPNDEPSDEDINYNFFLASALKEKGVIAADEISEDIDEETVIDLYRRSHEERIRSEEEQRISTILQSRGITDEHLTMAMAIQSGYSPDLLLEQNRFGYYASIPEEADIEEKKAAITEWYKMRNMYDDEIEEKMTELELDDEKFEINFNRAKEAFKQTKQSFDKRVQEEAMERERIAFEIQEYNRKLLHNIRTTGQIGPEKMTRPQIEQFERGLHIKDQTLELGNQVYQVSKFDKFIHDFQNNFETQLLAYKMLTMRELDKEILKKEVESKAEETLLSGLKTALQKRGKINTQRDKNGRQFYVSPNAKVKTVR